MDKLTDFEKTETDLLNLDNIGSLVRKLLERAGDIHLKDMGLSPLTIPGGYQTLTFNLHSEDIAEVDHYLSGLYSTLDKYTIPKWVTASIGEAVINAYVHGNKCDSSKPVKVHFKDNPGHVHVLIEDTGGELDKSFIPFLLRQREEYDSTPDFYEFSSRKKPDGRGGIGTIIIHRYSDAVGYYMSEQGGLILSLRFNKQSHN